MSIVRHGVTGRRFLADAWALTKPYWTSKQRGGALLLLIVIIALNLGLVAINVLLNQWNVAFYDALQNKDFPTFQTQLWVFCGYATAYIVVAVYMLYFNQMLQIRWRSWLTDHYLDAWLGDRAYYRLQLLDRGTDNPDQRLAEDLREFVSLTLSLSLGLLRQVVTLVSFLSILWTLSGPLSWTIGATTIDIPGYMVWAALIYAIVGTWLTAKIGGPLVGLNYNQQRFEADFRFGLIRFRENAEAIALYAGEDVERKSLISRFQHVVGNWWAIMSRQKKLTFFTVGYDQAASVFPILVAAPRYFSGDIQLGGLMQTASAFGQVQGALSFFVSAFTSLAEWKAVVDRLSGFRAGVLAAHEAALRESRLTLADAADGALAAQDLTLRKPDGSLLLNDAALKIGAGESVLVTGPSGSGKSTLFRALAGIWPFAAGTIARPASTRVLFLPQRPYLPIAKLRDVLLYPTGHVDGVDDQALIAALTAVGLDQLVGRLDDVEHWSLQLSPGEQQRIAVVRALVQKPDWLFLDEATAAVDAATEERLYGLLRDQLPGTAMISIGHRAALEAFHQRKIRLVPGSEPKLVEA